jgi:hypothetical protein
MVDRSPAYPVVVVALVYNIVNHPSIMKTD